MVKSMMAKLDTLDEIKERILCVERDMGYMKDSIEFAHAEFYINIKRIKRRSR
jgi:hypothetical protein